MHFLRSRQLLVIIFQKILLEIVKGGVERIKTACGSCHGGCGVIAYVKDGKVTKVEGDPESLISHGSSVQKRAGNRSVGLPSR